MDKDFMPGGDKYHGLCESCQKPITIGMPFLPYNDIDGLHLDCDDPYILPKEGDKFDDESPTPVILLGTPMLYYPCPTQRRTPR